MFSTCLSMHQHDLTALDKTKTRRTRPFHYTVQPLRILFGAIALRFMAHLFHNEQYNYNNI